MSMDCDVRGGGAAVIRGAAYKKAAQEEARAAGSVLLLSDAYWYNWHRIRWGVLISHPISDAVVRCRRRMRQPLARLGLSLTGARRAPLGLQMRVC